MNACNLAFRCRRAILALLLAFVLFAGAPGAVRAAAVTLLVDTPIDSLASEYNACTDAPDDCSLRGAVTRAADYTAEPPTILLPAGVYILTLPGAGETNNLSGDLNIRSSLTIQGEGADNTIIDGGGLDRILAINQGSVTLQGLFLAGGHAPDGADGTAESPHGKPGGNGGAIYMQGNGSLTLIDCVLLGNQAGSGGDGYHGSNESGPQLATAGGNGGQGGSGGAIQVEYGASISLERVQVMNNGAGAGGNGGLGGSATYPNGLTGAAGGNGGNGGQGGGVYAASGLTLVDSQITENTAGAGGTGGWGGNGGSALGNAGAGGAGGAGGWGGSGGGVYASPLNAARALLASNLAGMGGAGGAGGQGGDSSTGAGGAGGKGGSGGLSGSGGGIALNTPADTVSVLVNVTLTANQARPASEGGVGGLGGRGGDLVRAPFGQSGAAGTAGNGGGLHVTGSAANAYLDFVTFTANIGLGGGFENHGRLFAQNAILSGNLNFSGGQDNCRVINVSTPFTSLGNNLFGSAGNCYSIASDIINTNPGLLALADNGGPTHTLALAEDSPAIGAATCIDHSGAPVTTDQRGFARPPENCDIGAYQHAPDDRRSLFFPLALKE